MDYILNGQGYGGVASTLLASGFQPGSMRPYMKDGRCYIDVVQNGQLVRQHVNNAPATLMYDEWKLIDSTVMRTVKERLRAIQDLRRRGLTRGVGGNALGKTMIQWQTMSDITPATISMKPNRTSEYDRPTFDIKFLPLPIIHKDFMFDLRELETSRSGGMALDTVTAELAARRVAEEAEKLLIGVSGTYSYGGGTVYGYLNHPDRNTFLLDDPAGGTWTPDKTVKNVLQMKQLLQNDRKYGPYVLYVSPGWDLYLDDDYSAAKGDNTLRQRLLQIQGITEVVTLDFLTGTQMILVEMQSDTVQEVIGMDVVTMRWQEQAGLELWFKVMAMMVPLLRSSPGGEMGIVHGNIV